MTDTKPVPASEAGIILKSSTYESLKFIVQIVLPAIATLYLGLSDIWEWPEPMKVVGTITLITTFLGVVLRISQHNYNRSDAPYNGVMNVAYDGGGVKAVDLEIDDDFDQLANKDQVTFRIVPKPE